MRSETSALRVKIKKQNSWYTILVSLMIIGFLMVLTTWILNLVLREMNDNRWAWNYLKAYAWAEAAQELALLKIKNHWYWVYYKIDFTDPKAKILRNDRNNQKEILIMYNLNSKTKSYTWTLRPFQQDVIPLFYIETDDSRNKIIDLRLEILNSFPDNSKMAWNIISHYWDWIWWSSEINNWTKGQWRKKDWSFLDEIRISWNNWFLDRYLNNYLVVINLDENNDLEFNLSSTSYFTKPTSKIISSAKVWNYKQNLETTLDNTAFLSILKYSIYSQ